MEDTVESVPVVVSVILGAYDDRFDEFNISELHLFSDICVEEMLHFPPKIQVQLKLLTRVLADTKISSNSMVPLVRFFFGVVVGIIEVLVIPAKQCSNSFSR